MTKRGQPPKGDNKRVQCVNVRFSPAELEIIDKANAAEMPGKPRGAYVRYAALKHAATVDTSILELRQERWYYYSRDKYGREACFALNGEQRLDCIAKLGEIIPAEWQQEPAYYKAGEITPAAAHRRKMHALAALLRAEAAEQGK